MQVTVNADDFGMNENVTRAIAECFRRGLLDRTTAMVNMPWFDRAVATARSEGFADRVALHVNLVEGVPLTDEIRRSRFWCDSDGVFRGDLSKNKLWRFWMPREAVRLAQMEIDAQMEAFVATGLPSRHFDSHQYVCTYWPLVDVACRVALQNGFVSTRGFFTAPRRRLYCRVGNRIIDRYGLERPDHLLFTRDIPRLSSFDRPGARLEVHCHPNRRNADGERDDGGDLRDWTTPYEESFGLVAENREGWRAC